MNTLWLAIHYLRFHKAKTVILVACIGLTIYLPLTSHWLVGAFDARMTARARASGITPMVIGARGSRFDLVLHALNFRALPEGSGFTAAELELLRQDRLATPLPIYIHDHKRRKGRAFPIVGTSLDYLKFRKARYAKGGAMVLLGDCVLGSDAATALEVGVDGTVTPDPASLADLTALPLKLNVTGVLERTHTADDAAIFTDLKTAWIIAGHGHAHTRNTGPETRQQSDGTTTVFNPSLRLDDTVSTTNISGFHFHGEPSRLPLTAIIALPYNERDSVILQGKSRYLTAEAPLQVLVPEVVVSEMLAAVFHAKRFVDANQAVVAVGTGLFLILVVLLSLRLRMEEMETMFQLGCSRPTIFLLQASELGTIGAVSTVMALALAWATTDYVDGLMRGIGL